MKLLSNLRLLRARFGYLCSYWKVPFFSFSVVLSTLLLFFRMHCLISQELLSDRATYKDLSLNSYYGFFIGRKQNIYSTYTCLSLGLEEFRMLLSQEAFLFWKEKRKREKIYPLSPLETTAHSHPPHTRACWHPTFNQRELKTGQNPRAAPAAKENAVFTGLEPELTQISPEASL